MHRWPRRRTFRLSALIALLTIVVSTMIFFVLRNENAGSRGDDKYEDDDHTYEVFAGDNYHECLYYDDDTVYVANVCEKYDKKTCFDDTDPCSDNYWCDILCGSSCDEGEGAICYIETLKVT